MENSNSFNNNDNLTNQSSNLDKKDDSAQDQVINTSSDLEEKKSNNKNEIQEVQDTSLAEENKSLSKKLEEQNNKYLRLIADFENFKKRTSKEVIELTSTANKKLILNILPILDDLERYLDYVILDDAQCQTTSDENKPIPYTNNDGKSILSNQGINHIYTKLKNILKREGIEEIVIKKGEPFNPDICEAISMIKSEQKQDTIIDIVARGYKLNNKIIRYAKAVISTH